LYSYFTPALVPCFFALSGFLVAGSLERCRTVITFAGLRVLRIFPALAVETLLSAFLIGPLFTEYSRRDYFSDPLLTAYLGNLIGNVHFDLPGTFLSNPDPNRVNGQLWTVPYELYCYATTIVIALISGKYVRRNIAVTCAVFVAGYYVNQLLYKYFKINALTDFQNYDLIVFFLVGAVLFLYRRHVPWRRDLAFIGMTLYAIARTRYGPWDALGWIGLAYATVYFGLCNPPKAFFVRHADYSYGVYLYHYVILQAVTATIGGARPWAVFIIGLPISSLFAAMSWHLVEKQR
jgi:peptidoglycan/LPS O-acetylase OafA/YrhL